MTSDHFATAQQRVADRQQSRVAESRALVETRRKQINASRIPKGRLLNAWETFTGTQPAFRVGQLDSELLDEELLELLKGQAQEGLRFFGVSLPFSL